MSIFEAGMLLCFGVAWPVSIYKSLTSKSTKGKSFLFIIIILLGYALGITNKLLAGADWVIWLYILNFVMVAFDAVLYMRNRKREKAQTNGA